MSNCALIKNNLLVFLGPLSTLANHTLAGSVLGVLSQFDVLVLSMPSSPSEVAVLKSQIAGYKTNKPSGKVFGYTSLGGSLDVDAWKAAVDSWVSTIGTTALSGIFIDQFGFESPLSSRANQNEAVDYLHDINLAAFVRATNVIDVFDRVSSTTNFLIGRLPTVKDIVLLDSFFQQNLNLQLPPVEPTESVLGRAEFSKDVRIDRSVEPCVPLNIEFAALIGAGLNSEVDLRRVWLPAANVVNNYGIEYLGVVPYDEGATSKTYFTRNEANQYTYTSNPSYFPNLGNPAVD